MLKFTKCRFQSKIYVYICKLYLKHEKIFLTNSSPSFLQTGELMMYNIYL